MDLKNSKVRFLYNKDLRLDNMIYYAKTSFSDKNESYDKIVISTWDQKQTTFRFSRDLPDDEKAMIADSVATDVRWVTILKRSRYIEYNDKLIETIRSLQSAGLSGSAASTLATYVKYGCDKANATAEEIYSRFQSIVRSTNLENVNESATLRIYTDIHLHKSPKLADRFLQTAGSLNRLKEMHKDVFKNNWSEESIELLTKLRSEGLRYVLKFRFYKDSNDAQWLNRVLRITADLSNKQIAEAEKVQGLFTARDKSYWKRYNLFIRNCYRSLYDLPRIAALILVRYDYKILKAADNLLGRELKTSERSIDKLIAVCDFVENSGTTEIPLHWMMEF